MRRLSLMILILGSLCGPITVAAPPDPDPGVLSSLAMPPILNIPSRIPSTTRRILRTPYAASIL